MGKLRSTGRQCAALADHVARRWLRVAAAGLLGILCPSDGFAQDGRVNADLISKLLPQVVNLSVTSYARKDGVVGNMAGQSAITEKKTQAAGFIVDPAGMIATNRHAIAGAQDIMVTLHDGTRLRAAPLASSTQSDIALLQVTADRPLASVTFADSDAVRIGDPVLLIGNPLGLGSTVTAGIVSALDRNSQESGAGSFMQIDAALNHGNSGGPVFSADGQVVGMGTALVSSEGGEGSVGLGFMISSNDVKATMRQLLTGETSRLGWIGAYVESLTPDDARALGLATTDGSILLDITADGPAAHSGLGVGDVILKVDGVDARLPRILNRRIGESVPGRAIELTVWSGGRARLVSVAVADAPGEESSKPAPAEPPVARVERNDLGLIVEPAQADMQRRLKRTRGVAIAHVMPHSLADDHGIRPGSMILNIDQVPIGSPSEVQPRIDAARARQRPFLMLLIADDQGLHWSALPLGG